MPNHPDLETGRFRSGEYYCRPRGELGTCGFYPYPWTLTIGATAHEARVNFIRAHGGSQT